MTHRVMAASIAVVFVLAAGGCERSRQPVRTGANAELAAHSEEFRRDVITVTSGVHVAVGFGIANSILIEGDDGVIIVDTMESIETAEAVKSAFDAITTKPVRAVILTHNHSDHVFGGQVFTGDRKVPVYAHETTSAEIDRVINVVRPAIYTRSMRMFGTYLPKTEVLNAGIGPFLGIGPGGSTPGLARPTKTFSDRLQMNIAGVRLILVHAPGETNDQIFVWLPERKVLLPGDNVYKAFPNLYTIRGTSYRDVAAWVASLDEMRTLRPEFVVPSHTRPFAGSEDVYEILTAYRDAIQFVHDQTIRGMNRGLTADELVEAVKLPPHLANHPYLREYYGTVEWSVRSIFDGYLGWFSGNAAQLSPLGPDERARHMVALAEGSEPLLEVARKALRAGDFRWAAELADCLIRLQQDLKDARALKARALRALGEQQINANGRHYYLTQALELEGLVAIAEPDPRTLPIDFLRGLPISGIMRAMAVNLDPERSAATDKIVGFHFPDVNENYTVHVRRGVAEVQPKSPQRPDITVSVDSLLWKEILTRRRNIATALASGEVKVEGSTLGLIGFLRLFVPD